MYHCRDRCGECNKFSPLAANCDQLNILHSEINKAADKVKDKFTEAMKYFTVDVKLTAEIHGESNTTKSVEMIQDEVNEDITSKARTFEVFLSILKKGLSLSIALLFFQSFWYLRNYLAKDDYDNIYITSQFKELDKNLEREGGANVLPLKTKEKSIYVDPSSFRLNDTELSYCKIGLAQVLLHFVLCFLLLIFDFALYYILNLVRKYGDVEVQVEGGGHFIVSVEGNGPVALFYGTLIQGINLRSNYSASLEIGSCLPNPNAPSVAIIPVLIILYLIALCFVLLRGYGMRLRRKIAAYYYPKQETARMEYLHKKIRHKRAGLLKMIRQLIKSSHKETAIKDKLRLSTWLAFKLPFIGRFFLSDERLVCTSCEHTESTFNNIKLSKCKGRPDGIACDAVYCEECWLALNHSCPICTSSEEVALRE